MAGMFGMQTAESILKDRQDATRKNTLGIIASNKARDNSAAATSEKAAFDVASALTSFAIGKFGKGSEDAGNLEAVRGAQDDSAGMAQSAIDAADAPRVQNSSYAGAEAGGYGAGVRQEAMAQNEAYTQPNRSYHNGHCNVCVRACMCVCVCMWGACVCERAWACGSHTRPRLPST